MARFISLTTRRVADNFTSTLVIAVDKIATIKPVTAGARIDLLGETEFVVCENIDQIMNKIGCPLEWVK